jgi:hypothetical protein
LKFTIKRAFTILPVIPIALSLYILLTSGGVLPHWDEWNATAPVAIKSAQGLLTLEDIVRQHNEHKIVFTKMITALVARFTNWQMPIESLISVLLGCISVILITVNLQKFAAFPRVGQAAIASAFVFTLRDYGNIILPFQTQVFFVFAFFWGAVTALCCIERRWLALAIAALCGVGAIFSFLSGWILWPLVLIMLPFLGYRKWRYIVFWVVSALCAAGLYFGTGYQFNNSAGTGAVSVPLYAYVYYVLAYLGSMFAPGSAATVPIGALAGVLGIGLIVVNGWLLYRQNRQPREIAFWLLLAGYSAASALLSAIGRTGLFLTSVPNQPLETRYVIHAVPFWLAAIFLSLQVAQLHGVRPMFRTLNRLALVGLLVVYLVINSLLVFTIRPVVTPEHVRCALAYPTTRDVSCMQGIYPTELLESLRPLLDDLYKNRLTIYRDAKPEYGK